MSRTILGGPLVGPPPIILFRKATFRTDHMYISKTHRKDIGRLQVFLPDVSFLVDEKGA
jgi:hypothetical protein